MILMEILVHVILQIFFIKNNSVFGLQLVNFVLMELQEAKAILLCKKNDINCYQKLILLLRKLKIVKKLL